MGVLKEKMLQAPPLEEHAYFSTADLAAARIIENLPALNAQGSGALAARHAQQISGMAKEDVSSKVRNAYLGGAARAEQAEKDNRQLAMKIRHAAPVHTVYAGITNLGEIFVATNKNDVPKDGTLLFTWKHETTNEFSGAGRWNLTIEKEPDMGTAYFEGLKGLIAAAQSSADYAAIALSELPKARPPPPLGFEEMPAGKRQIVRKLVGEEGEFAALPAVFVNYLDGEAIPLPIYSIRKGNRTVLIDLFTESKWAAQNAGEALQKLAQSGFLPHGAIYYRTQGGAAAGLEAAPPEWLQRGDKIAGVAGYASLAALLNPDLTVSKALGLGAGIPAMLWFTARAGEHFYKKAAHKGGYFNPAESEDWREAGILLSSIFLKGKVPAAVRTSGIGMMMAADTIPVIEMYAKLGKAKTPAEEEAAKKEIGDFWTAHGGTVAASLALNAYFLKHQARDVMKKVPAKTRDSEIPMLMPKEVEYAKEALRKNLGTMDRKIRGILEKHREEVRECVKEGRIKSPEDIVRAAKREFLKAVSELGGIADKIKAGKSHAAIGKASPEAMAYLTYEKAYSRLREAGFSPCACKMLALFTASSETKGYTAAGHQLRVSELLDFISKEKGYQNPFSVLHDMGKVAISESALRGNSQIHKLGDAAIRIGVRESHVALFYPIFETLYESGLMSRKDYRLYQKIKPLFDRVSDHHVYTMAKSAKSTPEMKAHMTFADILDGMFSMRKYSDPVEYSVEKLSDRADTFMRDAGLNEIMGRAGIRMEEMMDMLRRFGAKYEKTVNRVLGLEEAELGKLASSIETSSRMAGMGEYFKNLVKVRKEAARNKDGAAAKNAITVLDYAIGSIMDDAFGRFGK